MVVCPQRGQGIQQTPAGYFSKWVAKTIKLRKIRAEGIGLRSVSGVECSVTHGGVRALLASTQLDLHFHVACFADIAPGAHAQTTEHSMNAQSINPFFQVLLIGVDKPEVLYA